jgi:His/Glu/Gln/Arg/opine family amino acid ABC transporter permease subunit
LGVLGVYRLSYALLILPGILKGFYVSLELVAVYIPLGFGVGFLVGWARTSQSLILRGFGSAYVDFFRSMPPLALIFFASLIGAVALKGTALDPYTTHNITLWLGVIALGLHTAGYQAEIVRAGILSIPAGQTEAADALGISRLRSMFVVVLPQAFRVSLPPLANEFSSVIKDSAYLSIIGWLELAGAGFSYQSEAFRFDYPEAILVGWFEVALLFFLLTYIVTRTLRGIEDAFRVPGLEAAAL